MMYDPNTMLNNLVNHLMDKLGITELEILESELNNICFKPLIVERTNYLYHPEGNKLVIRKSGDSK